MSKVLMKEDINQSVMDCSWGPIGRGFEEETVIMALINFIEHSDQGQNYEQ